MDRSERITPHYRETNLTLLHNWLSVRGVSRTTFSKLIGASYKSVEYWCKGKVIPDLVYAYLIEQVTKGGVPVSSWLASPIAKHLYQQRLIAMRSE